jgi:hypothetical protein
VSVVHGNPLERQSRCKRILDEVPAIEQQSPIVTARDRAAHLDEGVLTAADGRHERSGNYAKV